MMFFKRYRWLWIIAALLVAAGLALFFFTRSGRGDQSAQTDIGETAVAFVGDLAETATASGQVQAQREAQLSLARSGVVADVAVAVGDTVSEGDLLVQLETDALERAALSAEQDVLIARANLEQALAGPTAAERAAADASVSSAQTKLDRLLAGPTAAEIAASEASVEAARAAIWSASGSLEAVNTVSEADILAAEKELQEAQDAWQEAHDIWVILADCEVNEQGVHECTPKEGSERMESITEQVRAAQAEVDIKQAQLDALRAPESGSVASSQAGVASAQAQYDAAVARHEALLAGASETEIASAEAELASAKADLEALIAGPSSSERHVLEARLAQAETGLLEAQNNLRDASLLAPFDGTVTAVNTAVGEVASGVVVDLLDRSSLEVVLGVDEIDVGSLAIGQPAVISMETWPDQEIDSTITAIAPSPSGADAGVVSYNVHLALGDTDLPILVGMTANADLITSVGENVLLVPNAAITADRATNTYNVNLVTTDADGNRTGVPVEVTIGLRDDDFTQILTGLQEGDEVVLGTLEAPLQRFGRPSGGNGGGPGF